MLVPRSPIAYGLAVCLAAALAAHTGRSAVKAIEREQAAETRALWVTRGTLTSPAAIAQMVTAAQRGGFNTLVVQVRGRGDAYYKSTLEPRAMDLASRPGFDARRRVLQKHARTSSDGPRVTPRL